MSNSAGAAPAGRWIGVCWKWVGANGDARWGGVSAADRAALEIALRLGEQLGLGVTVVSAGPAVVDDGLREALATGADRAVRLPVDPALPSATVAAALATVLTGADWIVCGDQSADRGSGSVPAFLAAELAAAQALGLIAVDSAGATTEAGGPTPVRAVRRLDGGRREVLEITAPAVMSVEGSVASLRRASLPAELAAARATIDVTAAPIGATSTTSVIAPDQIRPFRPRARPMAAPDGDTALDRIRAITDAGTTVSHGETVTLDPPEAAARIVAALREWGYLVADP